MASRISVDRFSRSDHTPVVKRERAHLDTADLLFSDLLVGTLPAGTQQPATHTRATR
jgi:hypothetical protein